MCIYIISIYVLYEMQNLFAFKDIPIENLVNMF